jgi:hypothetical protein
MREGLVAACDDPQLFAFGLHPRQRELLEQLDRGPRLHVWAIGRRSGKTTLGAIAGVGNCLLRPDLDALVRPGERRYAVAVATSLRQARLFVQAAKSIVQSSPLFAPMLEAESEDELVFRNGTALAAFPSTSRGARGWPISFVMLDEAAHLLDTDGNSAAKTVFDALVPSTAQFGRAAQIVVSSTPFGSGGWFADLFRRAASGELPGAVAQQGSTRDVNPAIEEELLEEERARDPESFRSEYMAEFVGGGLAFLDGRLIDDAVVARGELSTTEGRRWVAGLDPAFSSDPFGVAIVGRDWRERGRLVLGAARAWRPDPGARTFEQGRRVEDQVLEEVAALCRLYGATAVTDQHRGAGVVDRLRRLGVSVRVVPMTAKSKTAAFLQLRARLTAGELELYDQPQLLAELRRLRTRYAAGRSQVEIPRVGGSHGDLAQALALGVYELRSLETGETRAGAGDAARPASRDEVLTVRRERAVARLERGDGFPRYGSTL